MKKLFVFLLILSADIWTQSGVIRVMIDFKTPLPTKISEWLNDPAAVKVIIDSDSIYDNIEMITELFYNETRAAWNDHREQQFRIPTTRPLSGLDLDLDNLSFDNSLRDIVTFTNSLPEGNYRFCITLYRTGSIEKLAEGCEPLEILFPDPPFLLYPADGEIIGGYPHFSWTPLTSVSPQVSVKYKIKIVPVFQGQSSRDAIDRNPVLVSDSIFNTTYLYTSANQPFSFYNDAAGFAWQVQAVDMNGIPAARNEGKSEIFTFSVDRQDSLNIKTIDSKISAAISSLRTRHANNKTLIKLVDKLESDTRYIFSSINSPDTSYLRSLAIHAEILASVSASPPESVVVETVTDVQHDMEVKKNTAENFNNSYTAFQTIPFILEIIEFGSTLQSTYSVRAIPWALRKTKKSHIHIAEYTGEPVTIKNLVAGVYDIWAVPVKDKKLRYPPEEDDIEIPVGMDRLPIYIK